ncbi:MAG: hypothetical protein GYB51_01595 [Rhodobacteraceae bacterium]|nr:hypothetical protein [Paracoccaceae bacterium]
MPSYFFRNDIVTDIPGALVLDPADVSPVFPYTSDPEENASGHWQFGVDDSSLVGLTGGSATLELTAGDYVWGGRSITVPDGDNYGVLLSADDSLVQTLCANVQVPADDKMRPVFTTRGSNNETVGMRAGFNGADNDVEFYDSTSTSAALLTVPLPEGVTAGDWICLILAEDGTNVRIKLGESAVQTAALDARVAASRKVALGWPYINPLASTDLKRGNTYDEAITFSTALDSAAMDDLYARRVEDARLRGFILR